VRTLYLYLFRYFDILFHPLLASVRILRHVALIASASHPLTVGLLKIAKTAAMFCLSAPSDVQIPEEIPPASVPFSLSSVVG